MLRKELNRPYKVVVSIILLVALYFTYDKFLKGFNAMRIRDYVDSYGAFAPAIYILLFSLLPIAFFPVPVLALAGGLSFGLLEGTIYTIIGAMVNSTIMFLMARFVARYAINEYLRRKLPEKWIKRLEMSNSKKGFYLVLIMRLIPIIPYNMINYVSGLTEMSFVSYSVATFVGIIPGTLVFLNIGDKVLDFKSPEFVVSIGLLILLVVVSSYFGKRISSSDAEDIETIKNNKEIKLGEDQNEQ